MLTVYGRDTSSNVQYVMWGAAELGLAPERLNYGHVHGGLDSAKFRAMTPHGLVPVLRDGDIVVWESAAILRYLAGSYGDGGAFWPADPGARARVDMWADWAKNTLAARFTGPVFWTRVRTAAKDRDEDRLIRSVAAFEQSLGVFAAEMGRRPFLLGDALTMPDIAAGHVLYRYFTIDVQRRPPPGIEDYYARLCERAAFRDHVMIDYRVLADPEA